MAAAAVVIAAVAVTGLGPDHSEPQKYPVPMPAPGASARQVVLAYLHALDAHDTATAEQLSTAGFRSETDSWLQSTAYWGYTLIPRDGRLLISDDGTG